VGGSSQQCRKRIRCFSHSPVSVLRSHALTPASPQLTCRIVFATASRLRPSSPGSSADPAVVRKLLLDAQNYADSLAIWRKPSAGNTISLLLLSILVRQGEIDSIEGQSYMSAVVAHFQHLYKTNPALITGSKGGSSTGIAWTALAYDAFAAVERKEAPILQVFIFLLFFLFPLISLTFHPDRPKRDYDRLLSRSVPDLPSVGAIRFAIRSDAWTLVNLRVSFLLLSPSPSRHALPPLLISQLFSDALSLPLYSLTLPLAAYIFAGRSLAVYLERAMSVHEPTLDDATELMAIWTKLEAVCAWGGAALRVVDEGGPFDDFAVTTLRVRFFSSHISPLADLCFPFQLYVNLSYCPSIFAQLAIVLHLEALTPETFAANKPYATLLGSRSKFAQNACAFLRDIRVRPSSRVRRLRLISSSPYRATRSTSSRSSPAPATQFLDSLSSLMSGTEPQHGIEAAIFKGQRTSSSRRFCTLFSSFPAFFLANSPHTTASYKHSSPSSALIHPTSSERRFERLKEKLLP
jgi:hypothetical protein